MPHRRKIDPQLARSRVRLRGKLPEVPVLVPSGNTSSGSGLGEGQTQSATQDDTVDENIRRMIEAAYT